jgi:hypothetical protein
MGDGFATILDNIIQPQLAELAPGDAGLRVEDSINKNMKRYEAVNDNIQRRSQKLRSTKQSFMSFTI